VNFDAANLILYGKANPVDALDILGPLVQGVHAKDGLYPTGGRELGREVPIGEGKVNFPAFIKRLKEAGYRGPLTIEREISGAKQADDIRASKAFLENLIGYAGSGRRKADCGFPLPRPPGRGLRRGCRAQWRHRP
jgi:sugar phosphate isomerase/epimerase